MSRNLGHKSLGHKNLGHKLAAVALAVATYGFINTAEAQTVVNVGIGTQDTTTNTVTAGTIIRQLKLLEKYLPKDGKYANIKFEFEWNNFTSGPPVTNGMMANKLQFGMMGDYPLVVNGFTFQTNPESKSRLIAVAAYNQYGSGNGLVVHKDSPYFQLSDLKGKLVSVPFGSAAHGMVLKAMQDRGWPADYFQLVSQTPEVGSTNLQEKKIDAHADFVPFAELLPFRGFARKIFDGVETNLPTWHGVVVRTDFAEKYPEVVVAYIKALIEANAWFRADPKLASEKIQEWTGINKEVVYIFLGPGGNMTTDPTIKPSLIDAAAQDVKVLQNLGRMKEFDVTKWVDDSYVRKAYAELKLDYDAQLKSLDNYEVKGEDKFCKQARLASRARPARCGLTAKASSPSAAQPARLAPMPRSRPRARRSTWPMCSTRPAASSCLPTRPTTRSAATRARSRRSCSRRTRKSMRPRTPAACSASTRR